MDWLVNAEIFELLSLPLFTLELAKIGAFMDAGLDCGQRSLHVISLRVGRDSVEGFALQVALQNVALPSRLRPPTRMTDAELMAFAEANKPCKVQRLASGEILVMTPSGYRNNLREAYVVHELFAWAETDGRGEVFSSNAGFNLPDGSTLSPDAGWVESRRVAALSENERERFLPFAPDFLIEILSPSDSLPVLDEKMERWIANGARLAWRIDPFGGTVAIYATGEAKQMLERPEIVEGSGPISGFRLAMGRVWN